jgi:hypothetical protein
MATRPAFIDILPQPHGSSGPGLPSPRPLTSPRLHVAGDVPPELSPLDAFAAQSRLLSKQLEGSVGGGRRMSRLPPLTIASSFSAARTGFFRSISADDSIQTKPQQSQSPGIETELDVSPSRPLSIHPLVSGMPHSRAGLPSPRLPFQDEEEQFRGRRPAIPRSDFGARVDQSPSPLEQNIGTHHPEISRSSPPGRNAKAISHHRRSGQTVPVSHDCDTRTAVPSRSPFTQKTPIIRSASVDSEVDHPSESREFSTSSLSTSPIARFPQQPIPRSSSVHSDISTVRNRLSRPTFNFSRPLSRAGEPPVTDISPQQSSSDTQPSIPSTDNIHTPLSLPSEDIPEASNTQPAAPSYVYSKFSLPRGKVPKNDPENFQGTLTKSEFGRDQSTTDHGGTQFFTVEMVETPSSPSSRPFTSSLDQISSMTTREFSTSVLGRHSEDQSNSENDRDNNQSRYPTNAHVDHAPLPSSPSASGRAIKAPSQHSKVPTDCSVEEHVTKGIECHERGSLKESTYHLRIAARQNHPTGMLLYALACRHGWGMRPNQREGVQWLRKAAESAFSEVAGDENLLKDGHRVNFLEQKTRKAQFALSIYELGVSHMNGWGIEQDKVLALRCFEIAGGAYSTFTFCFC